jgi:hypothetical protein
MADMKQRRWRSMMPITGAQSELTTREMVRNSWQCIACILLLVLLLLLHQLCTACTVCRHQHLIDMLTHNVIKQMCATCIYAVHSNKFAVVFKACTCPSHAYKTYHAYFSAAAAAAASAWSCNPISP